MLQDSIGQETDWLERVDPGERGQVDVGVFEGDQGEAELALDGLKFRRQFV